MCSARISPSLPFLQPLLFSHPSRPLLPMVPPSPPRCFLSPCCLLQRIHNCDLQDDDNDGHSPCITLSVGTWYFQWYTMPKAHSTQHNSAVVCPHSCRLMASLGPLLVALELRSSAHPTTKHPLFATMPSRRSLSSPCCPPPKST
jgi:hypothetical protein